MLSHHNCASEITIARIHRTFNRPRGGMLIGEVRYFIAMNNAAICVTSSGIIARYIASLS